MIEGGFLAPRRPQPIKLGLVVGAHAAVVAALMLAAAPKVTHTIDVFSGYNVPRDPPPPPRPTLPRTVPKAGPVDHLTTVPPMVPIAPANDAPVEILLTPPTDIVPIVPATVPPPPTVPRVAPPVTVEAAVDPRFADALQPPYPPSLQRQGITGSVTVRVLIGTDGRVRDVQQVSADDPGFFAATERQARRAWRFRPATRDGVPVESWRTMTAHFVLQ